MKQMQTGNMYRITFPGTELICRYKESCTTEHRFFSHLHYWNGFEKYLSGGYCVQAGIENIRDASGSEKHNLFRFEVEAGDV